MSPIRACDFKLLSGIKNKITDFILISKYLTEKILKKIMAPSLLIL